MFFLRVRNKVDLSAGNPEFVEKGDMFLTRKKYFETICGSFSQKWVNVLR